MTPDARADALDAWLPVWDVRERHALPIPAPDHAVWRALHETDLTGSSSIRWLFRVRGLRDPGPTTLAVLQARGFVLLGAEEPRHVVLGLIARPWRPAGDPRRATPEEFLGFHEPGYVRVGWSFSIERATGGSVLRTETRVSTTDAGARRAFRAYWWVIGPFSAFIRRRMLRDIARAARE